MKKIAIIPIVLLFSLFLFTSSHAYDLSTMSGQVQKTQDVFKIELENS